MYKKGFIIWIIAGLMVFCLFISGCSKKKESEAMKFAEKMGNGINLGNSLDATGLKEYRKEAGDLEYETFWGNPVITREQIRAVKEAGFSTLRIPVSWEDHMDEAGRVSDVWMKRVDEVVHMALEEGLYVILNTHHEEWLDLQTNQKDSTKEKFAILWQQIAEQFADCGEYLLFEACNEPRLRNSEHEWDEGTKEAREMLNELNQVFVDTVRGMGGNNATRYLVLEPYASNPQKKALEDLKIPEDSHILVSIHAYFPYNFCQNKEEGASVSWNRENKEDTREMDLAFSNAGRLCLDKQIPVILTEFGCVDKENPVYRQEWTAYVMELSEKYGIPCVWWDDGQDYKLLDRSTLVWDEDMLKILVPTP